MRPSVSTMALCLCVVGTVLALNQEASADARVSRAQNASPAQPTTADSKRPQQLTVSALMVEVTINRYQGDKVLSSIPYTIAVTPEGEGRRSTVRVGGEIAIPTAPRSSTDPDAKTTPAAFSYRNIGTIIDVSANPALDSGRYRISLTIEDSSVYPPNEAAKNNIVFSGAPAFRSFRSQNTVVLRHGQAIDYVAATDRINGETARISVKLTVVN